MKVSWDYIAGFFDGEGSVSTMNFTHRDTLAATIVTLSQTGAEGERILSDINRFLWENGVKGYVHSQIRRARYRQMHHLKICARDSVQGFLEAMLPRVSVKRVIVQDTLRFIKVFPSIHGPITSLRNRERGKQGAVILDVDVLKAERSAGASMKALAAKHGCTTYTIHKYLDPLYREKYDAYRKQWRQTQAAKAKAAAAA